VACARVGTRGIYGYIDIYICGCVSDACMWVEEAHVCQKGEWRERG